MFKKRTILSLESSTAHCVRPGGLASARIFTTVGAGFTYENVQQAVPGG